MLLTSGTRSVAVPRSPLPASRLPLEDLYVDITLRILLDVSEQRIHPLKQPTHIVIRARIVDKLGCAPRPAVDLGENRVKLSRRLFDLRAYLRQVRARRSEIS